MLWLPNKKTHRALIRLKRRRRRRQIARLLIFIFLLFGLGAASVPPEQALLNQVDTVTRHYLFDFVAWETTTLSAELSRRWTPPDRPQTAAEQQAVVQKFLDYEQQARDIKRELDPLYAAGENHSERTQRLEADLSQIRNDQADITPQAETILVDQIETVLREKGFAIKGQVFTPLAFRFIDPPTALIVSPRDRIENIHLSNLQPGLDYTTRGEIEQRLDQRGDVSSYVTDIGGLGSYPTMVIFSSSLPWLIEVIAHEWTHNYFYTFPTNLAWGYSTFPQLRTINETTADVVGKEISREVIIRFYPNWVDQLPGLDESGQPAIREPSEFDLAMRRIRQHVDDLLAEGKIEAAERYMEKERLKLVQKGYNLRKLNQAYFAFHGSYALSPAAIDPTGRQLKQLRAKSVSLKAFVDRVGWLNSYDDYKAWMKEVGIE